MGQLLNHVMEADPSDMSYLYAEEEKRSIGPEEHPGAQSSQLWPRIDSDIDEPLINRVKSMKPWKPMTAVKTYSEAAPVRHFLSLDGEEI